MKICQSCHEAAEITIPKPDKRDKENIEEIEELSSKQKKLRNDIESTSDEKSQNMLKNERKNHSENYKNATTTERNRKTKRPTRIY